MQTVTLWPRKLSVIAVDIGREGRVEMRLNKKMSRSNQEVSSFILGGFVFASFKLWTIMDCT